MGLEIAAAAAALCGVELQKKAGGHPHLQQLSPPAITSFLPDPLAAYQVPHIRDTKGEKADRVYRLQGNPGIGFNGTKYPEIEMRYLPSLQKPYIVTRTAEKPRIRLVFLHGLGLDISNVGSVVPSMRILQRVSSKNTKDAMAKWVTEHHPEVIFPMEIVAFDLPSAGWAPDITEGFTARDLTRSIEEPIAAINAADPLPTILVCRSASCAPSFLVGKHHVKGLVITGGTYPDSEVLDFNVDAIREMESRGGRKIARWGVIDNVVRFFKDPAFAVDLEQAVQGDLPILSLIGSEDEETPERARGLWANLIGRHENPYHRSAIVIPGGGHQVFRYSLPPDPTTGKPPLDPATGKPMERGPVQSGDPDAQAFLALLRFSAYHSDVWKPQGRPASILTP